MNKSETINELATALSKAQAQIHGASKDSQNPFFNSKYADLGAVWDSIRMPLTSNGLSVVQTTNKTDSGMVMETILLHSSGQWISGVYPINPVKNDPQGLGSATTYARRYSLAAIVGVYQIDDDGEAAQGRNETKPKPNKKVNDDDSALDDIAKFGKYKGKTWREAAADVEILQYMDWCIKEENAKPDSNKYKKRNLGLFEHVKEYAQSIHASDKEMALQDEIPF